MKLEHSFDENKHKIVFEVQNLIHINRFQQAVQKIDELLRHEPEDTYYYI